MTTFASAKVPPPLKGGGGGGGDCTPPLDETTFNRTHDSVRNNLLKPHKLEWVLGVDGF